MYFPDPVSEKKVVNESSAASSWAKSTQKDGEDEEGSSRNLVLKQPDTQLVWIRPGGFHVQGSTAP